VSVDTPTASVTTHRLRDLLTEFDVVLASEYTALRERDSERLATLVASKQRLANELEAFAPQIRAWQANSLARDDEWQALRTLLDRCSRANRTNGAAIDASRSFVTSMLDLLTGRRANERTYTARGRLGMGSHQSNYVRV
jgi:flagellar biosynthesis/type III secretory pathway chaperone